MANPASHPEGGVDYPRTLTEFDAWFVSETACAEFLGHRCVFVGRKVFDARLAGTDAWPTARGQLRCNRCQRQTSVTAGTIFEGTRKPLRLWFQAMWYADQPDQHFGVSALGVQPHSWPGQLIRPRYYRHRGAFRDQPSACIKFAAASPAPGEALRSGRDLLEAARSTWWTCAQTYLWAPGPLSSGPWMRQSDQVDRPIAAECRGAGSGRFRRAASGRPYREELIPFVENNRGACADRPNR